MFILNDRHAQGMRLAAKEAKDRGADLIIITDDVALADDLDESPIVLPTNGPLTALGGIAPLQLIAYELAMLR
jgi:glutamine---fructose-6-phosphate transaminase (isomerizing)